MVEYSYKKHYLCGDMKKIVVAALLLIFVLGWSRCNHADDPWSVDYEPSALEYVVTDPRVDEYMVEYDGMTVSFNPVKHVPNWVSWELTGDEAVGTAPRYDKFAVDPDVPGCATPDDYKYSGYDRGHMAPAGDMKWSDRAMRQSFYMTNICPQLNSLNAGAWMRLEEKCRQRAVADSAIIIVAGPILTDELTETIGATGVVVPRRFFKVVLSPYTDPPMGIGFIMNNGRVDGGLQKSAVSIDEVERITGHDFFSTLPDEVENRVESECNFNKWSTTAKRFRL